MKCSIPPAIDMTPIQREVIRAFRRFKIRYLVIGGQAMRTFGVDRATRDLDLWVARDLANAQSLIRYMAKVANRPTLERLLEPNYKITVGDPARPEVDILNSVAGDPGFDGCFTRSQRSVLGGQRVHIISAGDLLSVKQASAEQMDRDSEDIALSLAEREQAQRTALRDRRDIMLLEMVLY